jgi:ubiquinone/menaquinone biosynthesis C-methylase UbiE
MAALYDPFLWIGERAGMSALRHQLVSTAEGRVLELGAGTGLNVRHYPPAVRELVLSEPEPAMAARLRRRSHRSQISTEVVQAGAEELKLFDQLPFRLTRAEPARWRGMPAIVRPVVFGEAVAA